LGGFATLLRGAVVLQAFVCRGHLHLYSDKFGEAQLELTLFAVVCGTVPFGLYVFDEMLRGS